MCLRGIPAPGAGPRSTGEPEREVSRGVFFSGQTPSRLCSYMCLGG